MSNGPTLSVVMSNFNHARYLPESLGAILAQSYRPMEIIVIDDGSTDDSVEVIGRFARKEPRLRLIRNERNQGVLANVNRLLELASGDCLYVAAADDRILPGFLQRSMEMLARHPQAALCSASAYMIDAATNQRIFTLPVEPVSRREAFIPPAQAMSRFRRHGSWLVGITCINRKEALVKAGGFIPHLGPFCDEFIQMVLTLKHGACFIPKPLAVWRWSSAGYANSSAAVLEGSLQMWSSAADLMRTTYADLFPRSFVNAWEREKRLHAQLSVVNKAQRQRISTIQAGRGGPGVTARVLGWALRFRMVVFMIYLLVRFPWSMVPLLRRGLKARLQRFTREGARDDLAWRPEGSPVPRP